MIQIPRIIFKEIEKSIIHLIEIKIIFFLGILLRYTNISRNSFILVRPYLIEDKFKVILKCKFLV